MASMLRILGSRVESAIYRLKRWGQAPYSLLVELPGICVSRVDGPYVDADGGTIGIWFDHVTEDEDEREAWGVLKFFGARGFRYLNAFACGLDEIWSYHVLHEVPDSPWARDVLRECERQAHRRLTPLHHYRFYFDDVGFYEVVAERWAYAPDIAPPTRAVAYRRARDEAERDRASPCPCCESRTISKAGTYEICAVCNWEDDPSQAANPARAGGANELSLNAARAAWKANPTPLTQR